MPRAPTIREPSAITAVHVSEKDSLVIFNYHTPTPSADCKAQAEEMPKVWELFVKSRLKNLDARSVVLFPEDQAHQSVSFEFEPIRTKD